VSAEVIIPGTATGPVLRVEEPLSFWGGVDPADGTIIDARSPLRGTSIAGTILMLAETRGSSSSSAVMLELLAGGHQPAAVVLGRIDAILGLGIIVAAELGYGSIPLLVLPPDLQARFAQGQPVEIRRDGVIRK
jgi:predicted aconitase with swiveling domain